MAEVFVHKVTLSTGKIVLVREPKIKDQDLATRAASSTVKNDNAFSMGMAMQRELLKLLIVQVDAVAPKAIQLEDLDSLFTYGEFMQMSKVVGKIAGLEDDLGNFKIELQKHGE